MHLYWIPHYPASHASESENQGTIMSAFGPTKHYEIDLVFPCKMEDSEVMGWTWA